MGLPLVPFIVGAAVGAATTYLAKDKAARDNVRTGIASIKALVGGLVFRREAEEKVEQAAEAAEQTTAEVTEVTTAEQEVAESEPTNPSVH